MKDYAHSGLDLQHAFVDYRRSCRKPLQLPLAIKWNDLTVQTADVIRVPKKGIVRAEFISCNSYVYQGFDMELDGYFQLKEERVPLLRTWYDPRYESTVEYPFYSKNGELWLWNVYKVHDKSGNLIEEKWTGNAGFWVEQINPMQRIYHCSHSTESPPTFESLIFKITVSAVGE